MTPAPDRVLAAILTARQNPVMFDAVSQLDDESLAEGVARREESADDRSLAVSCYAELYRRHARAVLAFLAARIDGPDREDLLQRVWLKVWEKLSTRYPGGHFRVWLFQIARTRVIDNFRLRGTDPMGDAASDIVSSTSRPGDHLLNWERLQVMLGCLKKLEEREADVIRGLLGGEPFDDICSRLQIDSSAVRQATHSARESLRNCGAAHAMTLHVLDVPDDPHRIAAWLEGRLVGLTLGDLVAELAAVHHGVGDDRSSLDDVLGTRRSAVLQEGLSVLEHGRLRRVLQNPRVLLELQELALSEGGACWAQLVGNAETDVGAVDAVWIHLQQAIGTAGPAAVDSHGTRAIPWYRPPCLVSLATTVLVLLVVLRVNQTGKPREGRAPRTQADPELSWEQPGALPQDVGSGRVLQHARRNGGRVVLESPGDDR